jgi:hypothetical protein
VDRTSEPIVAVASCGSRMEGLLKVSALEDAGYRARLGSDDAGGLHPEMAVAYRGAYRVLVPASEEDDARALLAELDAGDHAIWSDPDHPDVGLNGRHRGWVLVAIAMLALFTIFRILDSAQSFGWF